MLNFRNKLEKWGKKLIRSSINNNSFVRRMALFAGRCALEIDVLNDAEIDIPKIRGETDMLLTSIEACQIFKTVKTVEKIEGDIAEVGTYRGGSAAIICRAKGDKPLHLFDTFEGIPNTDEIDGKFHKGQFAASFEDVKKYLSKYDNVYFYKGIFPTTAEPIKSRQFPFVHFDADTYRSASDCLQFFYPRMRQGGIIIAHDYGKKGVAKAFDEFFKDKPNPIITLVFSGQCIIVKS